ncbi:hypothetical protein [Pendulispora rubella]|uniref:hypothetical protein n=1 Tax=Pendulispora rubella TaxID=2741070 RepID=UPI00374E1FD2
MLFTATFALVQRPLAAKRDLRLERELRALDGFHAVILDEVRAEKRDRLVHHSVILEMTGTSIRAEEAKKRGDATTITPTTTTPDTSTTTTSSPGKKSGKNEDGEI